MTQAVIPERAGDTLVDGPPPSATPDGSAPPTRGNRLRMITATLVVTWFAAIGCTLVLELWQSGGDVSRLATHTLDETGLVFLLSCTVVWCPVLGLTALLGRLWVSVGISLATATVVGFATYQKVVLRQEPLYPSDVAFAGQAGFLGEMVSPAPVAAVAAIGLLVLVISVLVGRLLSRVYPPVRRRTEHRRWRALVTGRIAVLVAVACALGYVSGFNDSDNALRKGYERAGADWAFWFQKVNYGRNGFVAGFLYNLPGPAMAQPEGYDAATMEQITQKYAAVADRLNEGRPADALDDVNIVLVLSEAFSDPMTIEGPTYSEDPIPFTRSLMGRTRSGTMLAQLFGGGTANMEFEALTGMSLSQFLPQLNTPYQQLVTETETFPSAVGYLRQLGHRPIGIHPYMTTMYKRYAVYPTLGFERFVDEAQMPDAERIGEDAFVSDASSFEEVLHQLEQSDEPALVNLVTMQNHYPMAGRYDDPVPVEGVDGEVADHLPHYLRGLSITDNALRDFTRSLRRSGEKTAVVLYGDHAPAFWSGEVYDANGDSAFRRTPYLMWTSFDELSPAESAITSPIYFMPTLLDALGAQLPPYYALLLALQEEIGAMELGEYYLPDGRLVDEEGLSPRARELLGDYRLVQYDLAVGERHAQAGLFYPEQ